MINTIEAAKELAHKHVNEKFQRYYDDELVIMDDHTLVKDYGWIFIFETRKYLETRNISYSAPGGPIVVLKDGTIEMLGTALPLEEAVAKYEQAHKKE